MAKETVKQETKQTVEEKAVKKAVCEPTYTVEEFAKAPNVLGTSSQDIVRASLRKSGKTEFTIEEAKKIVTDFKNKGVK